MDWTSYLEARVAGNDPTLTSLNLSVYALASHIAAALQRNTTITELGLVDCAVPEDSARILFTKTSLTCLRILAAQVATGVGAKPMEGVRDPLAWVQHLPMATTLTTLRFSTTQSSAALSQELHVLSRCTSLESLSLPEATLSPHTVKGIVRRTDVCAAICRNDRRADSERAPARVATAWHGDGAERGSGDQDQRVASLPRTHQVPRGWRGRHAGALRPGAM